MATKLKPNQIKKSLKLVPDWEINKAQTELKRTFATKDFMSGLMFIARISVRAELLNHHPDVTLSYSQVKVVLKTHDVKGLTKNDFILAELISDIYTQVENKATK